VGVVLFGLGAWGSGHKPKNPNPQSPIPNPQIKLNKIKYF